MTERTPPVGVILCAQKGEAVAHYALEGLANGVLAREYMTVLPSEKLLAQEIDKVRSELIKREDRLKRWTYLKCAAVTEFGYPATLYGVSMRFREEKWLQMLRVMKVGAKLKVIGEFVAADQTLICLDNYEIVDQAIQKQ
jgi:hypothetical protein